MPSRCEICCEILIAILLPPLGVSFRHGCCSVRLSLSLLCCILFRSKKFNVVDNYFLFLLFLQVEFCICLLLTILGYVPGIIYALYAIVFIDRNEYFDEYRRPLYAPA
jgi:uncharacterized membrane protein YqaE (UPF0057 family)